MSYHDFAAVIKTGIDWKMASRQYSRVMLNELGIIIFRNKSMLRKE